MFLAPVTENITFQISPDPAVTPPVITAHPRDLTVRGGETATLSVGATGNPSPKFRWKKNGVGVPGATDATLTISNVSRSGNAGTYTVDVFNNGGTVTSGAATLTVNPVPVVITAQPVSQIVILGQSATFSVSATGSGPLSYTWSGPNILDDSSRTSATLTITNVQPSNAGSYNVIVRDSDGGAFITNPVSLTIGVPPAITSQPSSQTVLAGSSATFTVAATGTPAPAYQWQKGGSIVAGATNATLALHNTQSSDATTYSVVVSNAVGSVSSTLATLTVSVVPPTITTQPAIQTVTAGGPVTFSISATGAPAPTYQWRKDGVDIAGATSATLTLTNVAPTAAGNYTVVVTNAAGSATSAAGTLTVAFTRLTNISILTALSTPGDTFALGYVVGGSGTSGTKPLVIRAAGPSLGALGVSGTLDDPKIEFFAGAGKTGENDNWGGSSVIANAMTAVGAFAFAGPTSRDAAAALSVASGDNSVKVSAVGNGTGTIIAEIYDATPDASFTGTTPRLVNVSVLKPIGAGFTVGFYVGGSGTRNVLVRAIGPTLNTAFGVPGVVSDPQLTLYSGQTARAANDNWGGGSALSSAFSSVGAFVLPATSRDAAVVASLGPGGYTVQVSGVGGATGIILVEIYEVP